MDISKFIDHTELKPESPYSRYTELCREALEYQFASVCVNSFYVPLVSSYLKGFGHTGSVKVCSVVGFPFGASSLISKTVEVTDAIANGATEIDTVINIGALKSGASKRVKEELWTLRDVTKDKVLKVILEVGLLTDDEIKLACDLCIETNCNFVKTSTGFNIKLPIEKTKYYVSLLKSQTEQTSVKVKASGGIRTLSDLRLMLEVGADRIGTSNSVTIMKELELEQRRQNV
jgi:deoxyribose-phosphate aldolase